MGGRLYINDFRKLTNIPRDIPHDIERIYLNNNRLVNIQSGAFSNYSQCTKISLDWNRLTEVRHDMWNGLVALEWLSLEHNEIKHIEPYAFSDLPRLKGLYLHDNKLTTLPDNILPPKPMPVIEIMTLHGNGLGHEEFDWLHDLCDNGQIQEYTVGEEDILCHSHTGHDENNHHNGYSSMVTQMKHITQGDNTFSS